MSSAKKRAQREKENSALVRSANATKALASTGNARCTKKRKKSPESMIEKQ
jgi:hypothetical protein